MAWADLQTNTNAAVMAAFGGDVIFAGASVPVRAVFDNAAMQASSGPYGMASTQPLITLPTAQVPANPVGSSVVVGGNAYLVAAHEPDGTGISRLWLESGA